MDKVVILDRDGVINVDLMTYVTKPEEFEAIEGSLEAIALLNKNGYKVCIATNQACIEREIISENVKINDIRGTVVADKLLFDIKKQKLNIASFNNGKINAKVNLK